MHIPSNTKGCATAEDVHPRSQENKLGNSRGLPQYAQSQLRERHTLSDMIDFTVTRQDLWDK